ncbi:MAG: hypothetical protein WAT39_13850 [Planctomycetota bacterium]
MPIAYCWRSWLGLLALTLGAAPPAQTVWTVNPGNPIQPAIQAASPGDVVVLTYGFYDPFYLDRGLTIRGNGAMVGSQVPPWGSVTVAIPPGQVAHLDAINFFQGVSPGSAIGCPVALGGNVRVDRCTFLSRTWAPALSIGNAQVVIGGSSVIAGVWTGSGVALQAFGSQITLRDSSVTGAWAGCHPSGCWTQFAATNAAVFQNCTVHAERTTFLGGSHMIAPLTGDGAAAIDDTGGILWLADCTVTGGSSAAGNGATALVHAGTTPVELRSTQLIAGTPGGGTSTGALNPTAPLLRLQLQPVWTRGMTSTLTLRGDPNALHALFLTPAATAASVPSVVVEPAWTAGAVALAAGMLDAAGDAVYIVPVPNVASLLHAPVWCQAASGAVFPLRASTIAGGVVR